MNITETSLERAVDKLCVLLAPLFGIKNPREKHNKDKTQIVYVATWNLTFGGIRIAEIGVNFYDKKTKKPKGGTAIIRGDLLWGGPANDLYPKLFLICEDFLVYSVAAEEGSGKEKEEGQDLLEDSTAQLKIVLGLIKKQQDKTKQGKKG